MPASMDKSALSNLQPSKKRSRFFGSWRSNKDTTKTRKKPPSLRKLLSDKDFDTIISCLEDRDLSLRKWFDKEYSMVGENCLHLVLQYRPPAELVSLMLERLNESGFGEGELSIDFMGRTPLHHAVNFLCDKEVIQVLMESSAGRQSTQAQDTDGRLPLHIAMRPWCVFADNGSKKKSKVLEVAHTDIALNPTQVGDMMQATIELLINTYPEAALAKDYLDRRPFDYYLIDFFGPAARKAIRKAVEQAEDATKHSVCSGEHQGKVVSFLSSTEEGTMSVDNDDVSVLSFQEEEDQE